MNLNVENALTYVTKDPKWKKKCAIGAVLLFLQAISPFVNQFSAAIKEMPPATLAKIAPYLPLLLIVALLVVFFTIFVGGYISKNTNQRIMKPDSLLPEWNNWKSLFIIGFKASFAIWVYIIIFGLALIALFALLITLTHSTSVGLIIGMLIMIPCLFIFTFILSVANLSFVTDLRFSSYFNFKLMANLIKNNLVEFIIYLLICFGVSSLYSIMSMLLTVTIIGVIFLPFISFYQFLITSDLAAQFIRNSLSQKES